MAASDHLSQALFHGSTADLKPGDIINPVNREHAYATPRYRSALRFAKSPEHVYEVEPVNPEDVEVRLMKHFSPPTMEHISKSGFKVKKQAYSHLKNLNRIAERLGP